MKRGGGLDVDGEVGYSHCDAMLAVQATRFFGCAGNEVGVGKGGWVPACARTREWEARFFGFAQNDMWVEEQGMGRAVREPPLRRMIEGGLACCVRLGSGFVVETWPSWLQC